MSTLAVQEEPRVMSVLEELAPDIGQRLPLVNYHFDDIKERRSFKTTRNGGFSTLYHIPGVRTSKDCPSVFVVMDALERAYLGEKRWGSNFENSTAPQIARDLVKCGSGGDPSGAETILPAIWISEAADCPKTAQAYAAFQEAWKHPEELRRQFPLFAAEIERYKRREFLYCEQNLRIGDQLHSEGKLADIVANVKLRKSAIWMGADPAEHPWMEQSAFGKVTTCPFCSSALPSTAAFCVKCQNVVDPVKFAAAKKAIGGEVPSMPAPLAPPLTAPDAQSK